MDWTPSEMQEAIAELAPQILGDGSPWAALVEAELLELTDPLDIATLLIAVGKAGGTVPVLETLVMGAPVRRAGLDIPYGAVLTAGLCEVHATDPRRARTRVEAGRLYGEKVCVPALDRAAWVVVPTTDGLWAVRPEDAEVVPQVGTNGDALGMLKLDGCRGTRLAGREALDDWVRGIEVGICALLLGLAQRALTMTAKYASEREQFGKKIGTFQAVSQRAADAWIDTWAMEVTMWQAAWRLGQGLPCDREIAIARYVASEGAHRVTAAAQHLHGGMGFDRDYALHRYFLTVKQWEFVLGGASAHLARIGGMLAATSVSEATVEVA
jgi:alkylation response protein AidB-like acyl-CoA dehydrogenase